MNRTIKGTLIQAGTGVDDITTITYRVRPEDLKDFMLTFHRETTITLSENQAPEFTTNGIPVVNLETKLEYLKSCIMDGSYEDAIGHLDDLRNSVYLRSVLRGMRADDLTTDGLETLCFTEP